MSSAENFTESAKLGSTFIFLKIQSTLVISKSKGLSEILRDIRTSTYQICRIEEKLIRLTTLNKYMYNWIFEVRDILKISRKRREIALYEQFLHFEMSGYSR